MVKCIALGPGAMGYFIFLGVLSKLRQTGELADLEEISGASAGGLLALLFLLARGDTEKILDYSLNVQVKNIMKPSIRTFLKSYGLVSIAKIRKVFSESCEHFTGKKDMTFRELYEWNPIKLYISAYCVDLVKTVYFSVDSTPTMSVLDAVCATCAVPFLFEPLHLPDGWRYADGATAESSPCGPFLNRKNDVLAVLFEWSSEMAEIRDLKTYALSILSLTMTLRHGYEVRAHRMPISSKDAFDFAASQDDKLRMFLTGFSQAIVQ